MIQYFSKKAVSVISVGQVITSGAKKLIITLTSLIIRTLDDSDNNAHKMPIFILNAIKTTTTYSLLYGNKQKEER